MATTEWFDTPYYRQLILQQQQPQATEFVNKLCNYLQPAGNSTMLDIGCGEGQQSLALATKGFDVTGIDYSYPAIAQAKNLERDGLQFYQHDIRQPFWINYFDYGFNFFNSFGYYRTRREHEAGIRTIAQSLNVKGTLVLDCLNVHFAEDQLDPLQQFTAGDDHFTVANTMDEDYFYKTISVVKNGDAEPAIFTETTTKFSLGDFTDMLAYQGMQVREVFGDYNLGSYHVRKVPRMIILAQKIK